MPLNLALHGNYHFYNYYKIILKMGNDESGVRTHAVLQPIGLKSIALDHSAIPPYLHTLIYTVMFKLFLSFKYI